MTYVKIFYHGNCLDGAVSAALATLLVRSRYGDCTIEYVPLFHGPGFSYDKSAFSADLHVVVDFPFPGEVEGQLIWMDHHDSSFLSAEDRELYERLKDSEPLYWDPNAPSNSGLMLKIVRTDFGLTLPDQWDRIAEWVDMIDSGSFPTPDVAVELVDAPVAFAHLLTGNPDLSPEFITDLLETPDFDELAAQPKWSRHLNRVRQENWLMLEDVKEVMRVEDGVAYIDLSSKTVRGYNAFMPYYIDPSVKYAVALLRLETRFKISVGENPWAGLKYHEKLDVSAICEAYGGGGHVGVGAISFPLDNRREAEEVALKIFNEIKNFLLIHPGSSFKHIP